MIRFSVATLITVSVIRRQSCTDSANHEYDRLKRAGRGTTVSYVRLDLGSTTAPISHSRNLDGPCRWRREHCDRRSLSLDDLEDRRFRFGF
jgi:hypothetical protein